MFKSLIVRFAVKFPVKSKNSLLLLVAGQLIRTEVLHNQRAEYGAGLLKQLAERLTTEYGTSFSHSSLTRMVKFFDNLPDISIVATVSQQLRWSHFRYGTTLLFLLAKLLSRA